MEHYYVIPDLHGMKDLLDKMLEKIYIRNPTGGKIIFLGDYIDRGPDSVGVLNTVRFPPDGWEFIALMGNHEDMFLGSYYEAPRYYGFYDKEAAQQIIEEIDKDDGLASWMKMLPLYHMEDNNIFAHAWYDLHVQEEFQNSDTLLWRRMADQVPFYTESITNKFLTHGHTPRRYGPVEAKNRVNLDCGAVFYNKLVAAKFKVGINGPVEYIEVKK